VYETRYKGVALAWKRKFYRSGVGPEARKEITILRKLRHKHIVKLVGAYTHQPYLGLLIWPVAVCDLATFFDDLEWLHHSEREKWSKEKHVGFGRLTALGLEDGETQEKLQNTLKKRLWQLFGCLASAI
jgi:hypothetical protein